MTQPLPTALDQLLIKLIASAGTPLPNRQYLNFLNATVTDNPAFQVNGIVVGSTDVTTTGGGGGGGGGTVFSVPTTIVIDPIGGNDNIPGGPYKTVAKLNSVLTAAIMSAAVTVVVLSSPGGGDAPFNPQGITLIDPAGSLTVTGTTGITVAHSGTFTSGTVSMVPSSNTRSTVEDTALASFTSYKYKYLKDTTKNVGAWIMNAPAAHKANTTPPVTVADSPASDTFVSGNAYHIETRVQLAVTAPLVWNNTLATEFGCTFVDLDLIGFPIFQDLNCGYRSIRCSFPDTWNYYSGISIPNLYDCLLDGGNGSSYAYFTPASSNAFGFFFGGMVSTGAELGSPTFSGGSYVTGVGLATLAQSRILVVGDVGLQCQDTTSGAAAIRVVQDGTLDASGGLLWGTGNVWGVQVGIGNCVKVARNYTAVLTGRTGDFNFRNVDGTNTTTMFYFDGDLGYYVGLSFETTIPCTWATLYGDRTQYGHNPSTRAAMIVSASDT